MKNQEINEEVKQSRFRLSEVVGLVLITLVVSLFMGGLISYSIFSNQEKKNESDKFLEFYENYDKIKEQYDGDITDEELIKGAIKGMVETLGDDYSAFIEEEDQTSFDQALQGSYEGVGIEMINLDNGIYVTRVFKNSSAEKAGILKGDKLISIDGESMTDKTSSDFSSYILNNKKKKTFSVVYERDGKQTTVSLKKTYLVIPSVESEYIEENDKKIGYLTVSNFSATTYNQFKTELEELENKDIDSLIIDLRGNGGGHLTVVEDMLSLFMDKKHVIYQTKSKTKTEKFYSKGNKNKKYKIIVLQDSSSASASELMSSSLQEQMNAVVIGTNSYGKGTVQEVVDLDDGSQYKFTTKKWLTSKGLWINKKGVIPNIKVELNESYFKTGKQEDDNQRTRALTEASK